MTIRVRITGLFPWQREVAACSARVRVLAVGRRAGKSALASAEAVRAAAPAGRVWWVAPTYKVAREGWSYVKRILRRVPGVALLDGTMKAALPGGGVIEVRSADRPDRLRGAGLDFLVIDEAAHIPTLRRLWEEVLSPALLDRRGRALLISTPYGKNHFWHLYREALRRDDWTAFHFPTSANPRIDAGEIERLREAMSEAAFRQEILAEFLDRGGVVFPSVRRAIRADIVREPREGHVYVAGIDWAQARDFTVVAIVDATEGEVADYLRMNRLSYQAQLERVADYLRAWHVEEVVAETNAMGAALIERLEEMAAIDITRFATTQASKRAAIERLALAFERGLLTIPDDETLIGELEAMEATYTPSGGVRYAAPSGEHDDTVMALAMAWSAVEGGGGDAFILGE